MRSATPSCTFSFGVFAICMQVIAAANITVVNGFHAVNETRADGNATVAIGERSESGTGCDSFILSGATATNAKQMGRYERVQDDFMNDRPVYRNEHNQYLSYFDGRWNIGPSRTERVSFSDMTDASHPIASLAGVFWIGKEEGLFGPTLVSLGPENDDLGLCRGDCDYDSDCRGALRCFHRPDKRPVPGCSTYGRDNYDYCTYGLDSIDPDISNSGDLDRCQGDCDSDSDCKSGLHCFQRDAGSYSATTPVPGCSGHEDRNYGAPGWDYCTDALERTSLDVECCGLQVSAEWLPNTYLSSSNVVHRYNAGFEQSSQETRTETYKNEITRSVNAGLTFGGISLGASITATASTVFTTQVMQSMSISREHEITATFDEAGQVWQWGYKVQDACDASATNIIGTKSLVMTRGQSQPPCCPEGYAADPKIQHGPCSLSNLCSRDLCSSVCDGSDPQEESESESDSCFARETSYACRLEFSSADATEAYNDCFGARSFATRAASRVKMADLVAGDWVLSRKWQSAQILLNQHLSVQRYAAMLRVEHSQGSLELTPDHMLPVNGTIAPAAFIIAGSKLDGGTVTSVTMVRRAIINPLTSSGFILAAGSTGGPIVATHSSLGAGDTTPAGLLNSPDSLLRFVAMASPRDFQEFCDKVDAFDDSHLKGRFTHMYSSIQMIVPKPTLLARTAFDFTVSVAFVFYLSLYLWPSAFILVLLGFGTVMRRTKMAKVGTRARGWGVQVTKSCQ